MPRPRHDGLTQREEEVLTLLREGLTNEQISSRLGISFETAKHHVSQVLAKLGVATREEAAAWRPEAEAPRWTPWRIAVAIGGTAVFAAAVAGLALLAWGVSESGDTPMSVASSAPSGRIAFVSDLDGDYDIYAVDADGSDLAKLTDFGVNPDISNLYWSPSGERLLFEEGGSVYLLDIESRVTERVDVAPGSYPVAFPEDDRIWLRAEGDIVSMSPDGRQPRVEWRDVPGGFFVSLSPDHDRVLWSYGTFGHYTAAQSSVSRRDRIYHPILPDMEFVQAGAWSPDGEWIALFCGPYALVALPGSPTLAPSDMPSLCLVRADGSGLQRMVGFGAPLAWSPDGEWLVTSSPSGLELVGRDGTESRLLSQCRCQQTSPAWWRQEQ